MVVTLALASLAAQNAHASYTRINNYLVANVKNNDDIGPNIEAAVEWLSRPEGRKPLFLSSKPVSDLKKFAALQQVLEDTNCDDTAYEIMRINEKAINLNNLAASGLATRRVDKVMLKIFRDHAERCHEIYPAKYRTRDRQFDLETEERVVQLANILMEEDKRGAYLSSNAFYRAENLFNVYMKKPVSISRYTGEDLLKSALVSNAGDDRNVNFLRKIVDRRTGKAVIYKDRVKELVHKYLVGPCKLFTRDLGPDLFVPASLDALFDSQVYEWEVEYYLNWSYFKICQSVIENDAAVLNDVITSINRDKRSPTLMAQSTEPTAGASDAPAHTDQLDQAL